MTIRMIKKTVKSGHKTIFLEMTMSVVLELTQTRNRAEYILMSEYKLKAN